MDNAIISADRQDVPGDDKIIIADYLLLSDRYEMMYEDAREEARNEDRYELTYGRHRKYSHKK